MMVQRLWIVLVILVPLSTLFPQETEGLKAAPVGFRERLAAQCAVTPSGRVGIQELGSGHPAG